MEDLERVGGACRDDPVLDAGVIQSLRALSERDEQGLFGQLAEIFDASAVDRLASLRRARRDEDVAGLARAAHALRGSAAALGATRLCQLCAHIERNGASEGVLDHVAVELGRVRAALGSLAASG